MLTIEPSGGVLGATVRGLDLAQPLTRDDFGRILLALGNTACCDFPTSISILPRKSGFPSGSGKSRGRRRENATR